MQGKVATNHRCPHTPKKKPVGEAKAGSIPTTVAAEEASLWSGSGKRLPGVSTNCRNFEGPPKKGPYLLQCSRSGSVEQEGGGRGLGLKEHVGRVSGAERDFKEKEQEKAERVGWGDVSYLPNICVREKFERLRG